MDEKTFAEIAERTLARLVRPVQGEEVDRKTVEQYAVWMAKCGYEMTPFTVKVLADYLNGYNLWLCGKPGVGKTFFFDCMSRIRKGRGGEPIVKLSMIETQGWTMDTAREWVSENEWHDIVIDDLGYEPLLNHYGEKVELFPYLLECRMQTTKRTHLTSNLGSKDIVVRYKRRVSDRFVQFFKKEAFKDGESRRVIRPWQKLTEGQKAAT